MKQSVNIFLPAVVVMGLSLCLFISSCHTNKFSSPEIGSTTQGDSLSFIVFGDWGKYGGEAQQAVADQMNVFANKFKTQFFITTGDNFYPSGVKSIYDAHWQESFEKVYSKNGHNIPWYPTLGNHDYGGNPDVQVQYSGISKRWRMPARYYSVQHHVDSINNVLFAFTDTNPFVGYTGDAGQQVTWLQQTLSSQNHKWKIVVGHHPVYSSGPHGNTTALLRQFKPLFLQSKTDFYIAGHDHILEHSVYPAENVQYLISGGGATAYSVSPNSYTLFSRATPGFMIMTLYADKANIYFINHKGQLLYQTQVKKQL